MNKKNFVWVVEVKVNNKDWVPAEMARARSYARAIQKDYYSYDDSRIVKYFSNNQAE